MSRALGAHTPTRIALLSSDLHGGIRHRISYEMGGGRGAVLLKESLKTTARILSPAVILCMRKDSILKFQNTSVHISRH